MKPESADSAVLHALVVDDDRVFARALERTLVAYGLQVQVANEVASALALVQVFHFDVAIVDLGLPDGSGHDILRAIQSSSRPVPVIISTGNTDVREAVAALRLRAADYLLKPFGPTELLAALKRILPDLASVSQAQGPTSPPTLRRAEVARSGAVESPDARALRWISAANEGRLVLPPAPNTLVELLPMCQRNDWRLDTVCAALSREGSAAESVIRTANSALNWRGEPLQDLGRAVQVVGLKSSLCTALEHVTLAVFQPLPPGAVELAGAAWRNAVAASQAAGVVAARVDGLQAPDARLAALYHNLGELVVIMLAAQEDAQRGTKTASVDLARANELAHQRLGEVLAGRWGLPALIVRIAGNHHGPTPPSFSTADANMRNTVNLGWAIALGEGHVVWPTMPSVDPEPYAQELGLDLNAVRSIRASLLHARSTGATPAASRP